MDSAEEWQRRGMCLDIDHDVFFPSDSQGVAVAKMICSQCDVQSDCLRYALDNRIDFGVWGGTSERQRRHMIKARRLQEHSTVERKT